MTKKRLFRILAVSALLGILIFTFAYHLPIDRSGTYVLTVLNHPDDTTPVYETAEMEITLHRFFFRPTLVRGKIRLGDRTYPDMQTKWSRAYASYSFTENLKRKWNGSLNAWFTREEVTDPLDYLSDYILLGSEDYETFTLQHLDFDVGDEVLYQAERVE